MKFVPITILSITLSACGASWSEWESGSVPSNLQGSFVLTKQPPSRIGPERIEISSTKVKYRLFIEEDDEWHVSNSEVCGGASNIEGTRHNMWLAFLGECSGSLYLSLQPLDNGQVKIEEYVVPVVTTGIENNGRLTWRGTYELK